MRLVLVILSGGALLMAPLALSGARSAPVMLLNVIEQAGPLLTGWRVAAPIAILVWLLSIGKPWANAGRSCMAFSASMQAAAIFLVAMAFGPVSYNFGLLVLIAASLPAALSVPWALAGWLKHAWFASTSGRSRDGLTASPTLRSTTNDRHPPWLDTANRTTRASP